MICKRPKGNASTTLFVVYRTFHNQIIPTLGPSIITKTINNNAQKSLFVRPIFALILHLWLKRKKKNSAANLISTLNMTLEASDSGSDVSDFLMRVKELGESA